MTRLSFLLMLAVASTTATASAPPAATAASASASASAATGSATAPVDAGAGASTPSREHFAPPGTEAAYHQWHYTPVLKVGDQVIVSGIPAMVGDTYEAKVRWMFEQLRAHLETAGASLADVVELTSFHVGATDTAAFQAEFARFAPIHAEYFPSHYPAWSAVGTTALLADGAPVELRAVAVIGSGRAPRADIAKPHPRARPVTQPPAQAQPEAQPQP